MGIDPAQLKYTDLLESVLWRDYVLDDSDDTLSQGHTDVGVDLQHLVVHVLISAEQQGSNGLVHPGDRPLSLGATDGLSLCLPIQIVGYVLESSPKLLDVIQVNTELEGAPEVQ